MWQSLVVSSPDDIHGSLIRQGQEPTARESELVPERILAFVCNLCEAPNQLPFGKFERENPTCSSCGSTVRVRGLLRALSLELFGMNLTVPGFPQVKSLRGVGTSDIAQYASTLAEKFDYRNTFYDRAPLLDLTDPPKSEFGQYDFVISSEVLEHVPPPVEDTFSNVSRLLKPTGVLLLTLPYSIEDASLEHFPELYEYTITKLGEASVLVNRTRSGDVQVFENLVFHLGSGAALEMRELCEKDLMKLLAGAGFAERRVHGEDYEPFGVIYREHWSLPIAARRSPYAARLETVREIVDEYAGLADEVAQLKTELAALKTQAAPNPSTEDPHPDRPLRRSLGAWSKRLRPSF
jgi:SAM-dependent methyltransferase